MTTLIFDLETDGLLPDLTKIWCLQIGDADTDEVTVYADRPGFEKIEVGVARLRKADLIVSHNGTKFDVPVLQRFFPGPLPALYDTLIMARLTDPEERQHGLKVWGQRIGTHKGDYTGDFQSFTDDLVEYARQDIVTGRALYHHLKPTTDALPARLISTEHAFAAAMFQQEQNGFTLDIDKAITLEAELRQEMADIDAELQRIFPPREVVTYSPKKRIEKRTIVPFNPGSRHHVGQRLIEKGWKPKKIGKDGKAAVDETILSALPYPEAKVLVRRFTLMKMLGQLSDGKTGWLKLVTPAGKVHGSVNTIGCAPGRCSHSGPNLAQVTKKDHRMREVWTARPGWKLVGCDGEGLQARILAHYLHRYDGGAFAKAVHEGDKKARTDVHSANLVELSKAGAIKVPLDAPQELWDKGRDGAKRCLYACWFGASDKKLGWTAKDGAKNAGLPVPRIPDVELGRLCRMALNRAIKGFERLSNQIKDTARERGYLISPLGRHVPIRSPHSALVFLMQSGEADVMRLALVRFAAQCAGYDYAFVANVHDEAQLECPPGVAEELGRAFAACITQAGEELSLRCPLAGSYSIGDNWSQTH